MKNLTLFKYCLLICAVFFTVQSWGNNSESLDCPELFSPSCSPPSVCAGQPFDLLVGFSNVDGGVLQWFDESGNPVSSSQDLLVDLDYNECAGAQYGFYASYTPADATCPTVTTDVAYVTVYPPIAASITNAGCSVSLDNYCDNFNVTWSDGYGNMGSGPDYSVPTGTTGTGTVTFTMTNPDALAPCNTQEFALNFDCVNPCPVIGMPTVSQSVICFGEAIDLDVNVMNMDGGTLVWYDSEGNQMGEGSNINLGLTQCNSSTPGFYATYFPATEGCEPVTSSIVNIEIFPEITADVVVDECLVSLDNYCEDFAVTWQDSNGNSGSGGVYNALAGDNGIVSFYISNPEAPSACQQKAIPVSYDCPAPPAVTCPEIVSVSSTMDGTCNYQGFALSANLINDGAGGTLTWAQTNGVAVADPSNVVIVNEECTTIQYGFVATYTPNDPACPAVTSEIVFVNVYPQLTGVMVENGCTVELTGLCEDFIVTWVSNSGKPGEGAFFEGTPGETGFVEYTVYNPNAAEGPFVCQIMTTTGDYDCTNVDCPVISNPMCQPPVICQGEPFGLVLSTNNLDGGTLSWYDENDNVINNPDEIFVSASACASETYGYYAVYNPTTFGCSPIVTELAYVTVHPQIDAEVSGGTCTVSLSNSCPDHSVTWTDNLGNAGTGNTYLPGANESGTVTFNVTNPAAAGTNCASETLTGNFACGSDEIFDLALTKTLAAGQSSTVSPGDMVTFTITVYNQGTVAAQNIFVSDYFANGLILADGNWTDYGTFATVILGGPLAAGASQSINITFIVDNVPPQGIENLAEISSAKDPNGVSQGDIDSNPDYIKGNDGPQIDDAINDPNDEDDFDGATLTIVDCPSFSAVSVSAQDVCSYAPITLDAGIAGDDGGTLTWYYTDGTAVADPSNLILVNDGCAPQAYQVYAEYVPADAGCPAVTSEIFVILVYPVVFGTIEPVASADGCATGCAMELVTNCPNFTVTYTTTTSKNGTGTTFTAQPGESGNIEYTIYNTDAPNAPFACQFYTTSSPFECGDCPNLINPTISDEYICSGEAIGLNVDVLNGDNGTLNWFNATGAIVADPTNIVLTNTGCGPATYEFYPQYIPCNTVCETITLDPLTVQVFPIISANVVEEECSVYLTNLTNCDDYTITWQDNLGNSGTGMVYNATQGTSGTVSFTINNTSPNAPATCGSLALSGAFDCAEDVVCTSLFNPQTIPNILCSGGTFDLSVGINNGDGGTIQWFDANGAQVMDPSDILVEVDGCGSSTFGYYATYTPANAECPTVTTDLVYVTIYPQISAIAMTNDCQISLTEVCNNYGVTWVDDTGATGTGLTYTAAQGTTGTVTFTVAGTEGAPAGCQSSIFTAEYECAQAIVCPDLFDPMTIPSVICDGETFDLSVGIINGDGGLIQWYDFLGNPINNPSDVTVAFDGCAGETFGYYATYTPMNSECPTITSETTFVQVFPGVTANTTVTECSVILTDVCPNFDVIWSDSDGNMGTGTVYNASAGTSGTLTFTVTNSDAPAACQSGEFTNNYACAEELVCMASIIPAISDNVVCSGASISLSETIASGDGGTTTWYDLQGGVVANPNNIVLTNTGCDVANYGYYAIYTPANPDCPTVTSEVVSTMVYPELNANAMTDGCTVSLGEYCPNLDVTWSDSNGASGAGPVYVGAAGTSGTVTFTLSNPGAPAACNTVTTSASYTCASMEMFDLALVKTLGPNQSSVVAPGQTATFAIYVYNQGTVAANNIEITDYIPAGLTLADANWTGNGTTATTVIPGPIQPGAGTNVLISFTVNANASAGNLTNFAEISEAYDPDGNLGDDKDSTPDANNGNDGTPIDNAINDPNDEDDHDPADLTIVVEPDCPTLGAVSISDSEICSGGSVSLSANIVEADGGTLAWYTSQGTLVDNPSNIVLTNTSCSPAVYGYYAYYIPANSQCTGFTSTVQSVTVAPQVNATVVENSCQVYISSSCNYNISWTDNLGNSGSGSTYNAAEGTSGTVTFTVGGSSGCSTATYSGNFNCAPAVTCPSFNSVSVNNPTICSGQSVSLSAMVNNQDGGQLFWYDLQGFLVNDPSNIVLTNTGCNTAGYGYYAYYIPANAQCSGFTSQVVNVSVYPEVTAQVVNNGCQVYLSNSCSNYNVTWTDNLGNNGSGSTYNATEGTNGSVTFSLSNPGAPATCNSGTISGNFNCASTSVFDIALIKTLGASQSSTVSPGDVVTFNVYIYNQGTVPAYNIDIVDYIPAGLTLNDPSWTANGSTATTTMAGPVQPGSGSVVTVTFTVNSNANAGTLTNYAEITGATDGAGTPQVDIDSTPDANNGNDGTPLDNSINSPNDEDDHDLASINITQPVNCPTFGNISVNTPTICSGGTVSLSASINGNDGGQLFWYDLQGNIVSNPSSVVLTNTGCMTAGYGFYAYYIPANTQCGGFTSTVVNVSVLPEINASVTSSANGCTVSLANYCTNFNVVWNDNLGNSGTGSTYMATAGTSGTVTFFVTNSNAPAGCNAASVSGNFNCAGGPVTPGPSIGTPGASSTVVCSGSSISLTAPINNGDGGTTQWYQTNGTLVSNPNNITLTTSQCGGQSYGYYAVYTPSNSAFGPVTSTVVNVVAYPAITGELVSTGNGCTVSLINACENLLVTWTDNVGNTGSGNVYTATSGTSGTVTFTLTQADNAPAGCGSMQLTSNFNCAGTPTETCDPMYYCTSPGVAVNICPDPCTITGAWSINNVASEFCGCVPAVGTNCFEYTPLVPSGTEEIIVTICNASYCENIPVIITVDDDCNNDSPAAADDIVATDVNTSASFDVMANDNDPDGDQMYVCALGQALNGTIDLIGGIVYYTPNTGFIGTDFFTYTLCDGNQASSTANVYVNVNPAGQGLAAQNDAVLIVTNDPVDINILANDNFATTCTPTVTIINPPTTGSVTVTDQGMINYTPYVSASGSDSFTYQVCCGSTCETAMVDLVLVEGRAECPGLEIPTGFSPNGDGVNEHFRIDDLNACFNDHEKELLIFDRNGEIVYNLTDYDNGFAWDGCYKNQPTYFVPEGTYFYVLKISKGNSIIEKSGNVRVKF